MDHYVATYLPNGDYLVEVKERHQHDPESSWFFNGKIRHLFSPELLAYGISSNCISRKDSLEDAGRLLNVKRCSENSSGSRLARVVLDHPSLDFFPSETRSTDQGSA
jgi:hypothetical protein